MSARVSGLVTFCHSNTWRELSAHLNWRTNSSGGSVQRHKVAVDVVKHFNRSSLGPHEVQRSTAGIDLDVAFAGSRDRQSALTCHQKGADVTVRFLLQDEESCPYLTRAHSAVA